MFGAGFWGGPIGHDDHLTRERDPPPRPIELEFPQYVPPLKFHPLTSKLSSQLRHKICHSKAFQDISDADLELLNLRLSKDVTLSSLLPDDQFTARPLLFDDDLQAMLDEISISNEDAFREVLRMPPSPGRKKPKLAYARNFFGSLEDMARYLDSSKDEYYRIPLKADSGRNGSIADAKPPASDVDVEMQDVVGSGPSSRSSSTTEVYKGYRIASAESMSSGTRLAMLKNLLKTTMHRFQCRDHEPIPQPREKLIVRGVRIQAIQYQFCVARIPTDMKLARARQVEGPVMAVATRDELRFKSRDGLQTPDKTPFVGERFDLFREVGCMLILATQRARTREDKTSNVEEKWWVTKQRWGGGATQWGQLASEIYEDEDPSWSPAERKLQEDKKQKEADEKAKGIADKAVDPKKLEVEDLIANNSNSPTTKASALIGNLTSNVSMRPRGIMGDFDPQPRKKKLRSMERPPGDEAETKNGRRVMYLPPFKKRWYQDWQKLRPNTSMTDSKIISKKIGAEEAEFDEVFMLTSVNHHVALVKMRVHPEYLAWLESGHEVADEEVQGLKKNVLHVSRTTWFDVFDVEARKELLIGLWRVFCWINRDYVPKEEYEKMQQKQQQQQHQEEVHHDQRQQ